MVTRAEALLELERRGELGPEQQNAVQELRRRGEIAAPLGNEGDSEAQTQETWGEYAAGLPRAAVQGLSFGFGDEAEAAIRAPFSDRSYGEIRDDVRDQNSQFSERHPYQAFAAELAGGAAVPFAGAANWVRRGANTLAKVTRTGAVGGAAGGVSGFGSGEGGVGNRLENAGWGAGGGFVLAPALTHAAAPAAKWIGRKVVDGLSESGKMTRDALGDVVPGFKRSAYGRIGRALERGGQTPEDAIKHFDETDDLAKFGKTQVAVPEAIADVSTGTRRLSRTVQMIPGRGNERATEFLEARQRGDNPSVPAKERRAGMFGRTMDYVERAFQVRGKRADKEDAKLIADQKAKSDPAYGRFRAAKGADDLPLKIDVGDILAASEEADANLAPDMVAILKKARSAFMHRQILRDESPALNGETRLGKGAIAGEAPTTRLEPSRFESGYRQLEDMISAAEGRGLTNQVRLLTGLKNEIRQRGIDATSSTGRSKRVAVPTSQLPNGNLTPVYDAGGNVAHWLDSAGKQHPAYVTQPGATKSLFGAALDAYSGPQKMRDALAKGRTFANPDNKGDSVTMADYRALSSGEKRMFRTGAVQTIRKVLGGKTTGSDVTRYFDTPNMAELVEEIAGGKRTQQFYKLLEREGRMVQSRNANRDTQTAPKQEDLRDFSFGERIAAGAKGGNLIGAVYSEVAEKIASGLRMRENAAEQVAKYIYETDPLKKREILRMVAKEYSPSLARRMARSVKKEMETRVSIATQTGRELGQEQAKDDRGPTEVTISRPRAWDRERGR